MNIKLGKNLLNHPIYTIGVYMASYSAPSSRPFIVVNFACKFSNTSMNTPEAKIDSATSPAKPENTHRIVKLWDKRIRLEHRNNRVSCCIDFTYQTKKWGIQIVEGIASSTCSYHQQQQYIRIQSLKINSKYRTKLLMPLLTIALYLLNLKTLYVRKK